MHPKTDKITGAISGAASRAQPSRPLVLLNKYLTIIIITLLCNYMQITLQREERRDDNYLYNPMTIKELSEKVPDIPWLHYVNTILAPDHVLTEDD